MIRRSLWVTLVSLAVFPSAAKAYQFSISDPYHRLPAAIPAIERAVSWQVNTQVAKQWKIDPVSFVSTGGIIIHLLPQAAVTSLCGHYWWGCHAWNDLYVSASVTTDMVENTIDHEVIETEVDRWGTGYEICDPASIEYQGLGGVWLNDWVYPSYYSHMPRPRDYLGAL